MGETTYKRKLRQIIGGWSESYEPARGSGVGYPDLQFLFRDRLVPVEVKCGWVGVGSIIKKRILFSESIRPSQIMWHHNFKNVGGESFVLICCGKAEKMNAWTTPDTDRNTLARWRDGWNLDFCWQWVRDGKFIVEGIVEGWAKCRR